MYYLVDVTANQKKYGSTSTLVVAASNSSTREEPNVETCSLLPTAGGAARPPTMIPGKKQQQQQQQAPPSVFKPSGTDDKNEYWQFLSPQPEYNQATASSTTTTILSVDQALDLLGMGRLQYQILLAAGLCFMADAMEIWILSFLSHTLSHHWDLSVRESVVLIPSIVFPGSMVGAVMLGWWAGWGGRRPVFCTTAAMIALFGWMSASATTLEWLLVARFGVGFGVGGLTVPFDTLAEFLPSHTTRHINHNNGTRTVQRAAVRARYLLYTRLFWTAGVVVVPLCLWRQQQQQEHQSQLQATSAGNDNDNDDVDSWRPIVRLCTLPCVVSALLALVVVPESPRWLLAQGRHEQALQVFRQAARVNGHTDPYRLFPSGSTILLQHADDDTDIHCMVNHHNTATSGTATKKKKKNNDNHMLAPKWRKTTLALWGTYFGLSFMYHGMITLAVCVFSDNNTITGSLQGGQGYRVDVKAVSTTVGSELLGVWLALATIDMWGRNPTQNIAYLCAGGACLVLSLLLYNPNIENHSDGRVFILLAFCQMYLYAGNCTTWVSTVELLPTAFRTSGHAVGSALGRVGGLLSWYIITKVHQNDDDDHHHYQQQAYSGGGGDRHHDNDNTTDGSLSLPIVGFVLFLMGIWTAVCSSQLPETQGEELGKAHVATPLFHQLF